MKGLEPPEMIIERRRAIRYNFGAIAEISDLESRKQLVAVTRDLSLSGCFIATNTPFNEGAAVKVRITSSGTKFSALGNVSSNVTWEGMGIAFTEITPSNRTVIEQWLSLKSMPDDEPKAPERRPDNRSIQGVPVTVSGESSAGPFTEETKLLITTQGALLTLAAPLSSGQVVRIKNRLTGIEQDCCILFADPKVEEGKPRLLAVQFLDPLDDSWRIKPAK